MLKPKTKGIYLLTIRLSRTVPWLRGTEPRRLERGWYTYVGSAMGGVAGRLARHLRTTSPRHWHVDHLLAAGKIRDIQIRQTRVRDTECQTAAIVRTWPGAEPVPGFGASDCRCDTHLFRFTTRPGGSLPAAVVHPKLGYLYRELRRCYENHALHEHDPFRTLVSCILSLRTQDPVTDAASTRLFAELQTPEQFAVADPETIAEIIFPVGMYRQKADRLVEIAGQLLERFNGQTPSEIDELTSLPGVGRKTANLVRSFAFHLPAICVDTHVHRITNRWGLVRTAAPDETERELRACLPLQYWLETNALLVRHGQQICRPTRPNCTKCPLEPWCNYPELLLERQILDRVHGAPTHPCLKLVNPR